MENTNDRGLPSVTGAAAEKLETGKLSGQRTSPKQDVPSRAGIAYTEGPQIGALGENGTIFQSPRNTTY